jgi:hypothetical protein
MDKKTPLSTTLVASVFVSSLFATSPSFAQSAAGADCNNSAIQQNANAIYQAATNNYNQMVQPPANLDGCLGALSALNLSVGTFDLTSIFNQLIQQACSMATSAINNVTNGAINQINGYIPPVAQGVISVGSGGTSPINSNNGAANSLLNPAISGVTNGVQNKVNGSLSNVFGQ